MCGICGVLNPSGAGERDRAVVREMTAAIVHRGPDGDGFHDGARAVLGMRRLRIIDLRTGDQPIYNEDRTVALVFNGEIYNFRELRRDLEARGHRFATRTDTEVIVHLYEEEGDAFVRRLNGMFAIALWDDRRRRLVLARDRMGVKPLHLMEWDGRLWFASEIKSLLRSGRPREIDPEALSEYVSFEYVPAPRSIFKGITKLPPACLAVVEDGARSPAITPYWDVRFDSAARPPRAPADIAAELRERLRESVRMRLVSDVPLGVFLSGGVDSSAVTALMAETAPDRVRTFSIGFRERTFDEIPFARRVAERFGTEHTEFVVGSDQVRSLTPRLVDFLDEPLADASVIPTYLIAKLAREHVTVALAGDGGDELFCGYDTYKAWRIARLWRRLPRFVRSGLAGAAVSLLPASEKRLSFEFKARKFLSGIEHPPEIANTIWWGAYGPAERARLLSPAFAASLGGADPYAAIPAHLAGYAPEDELDRICYLDLKMYLQDDLLVKVDRMTMASSLELRVPFLDYTFVEFAAGIPRRLKLRGGRTKAILKDALADRLPPEILDRRKIGFDIPLGPWLRDELRDFAGDVLAPARLRAHGFFDDAYVGRVLREHMAGKRNHRQLLWPLIVFQHWYDRYMTGAPR